MDAIKEMMQTLSDPHACHLFGAANMRSSDQQGCRVSCGAHSPAGPPAPTAPPGPPPPPSSAAAHTWRSSAAARMS